jgi:hypothetical protein
MSWGEVGREFAPWATIGGMCFAALSILIAASSLRHVTRTNKAKFVFDVTDSFLKDGDLQRFWYRLDYDSADDISWKFDLHTFRQSEEERLLDALLYKFDAVGLMLRTKAVHVSDLEGLFILCRQTFSNADVREYLRFHQLDFWHAYSLCTLCYADALYLYQQLTIHFVNTGRAPVRHYADCSAFICELRAIPSDPRRRKAIATRIGYDKNVD